MKIKSQVGPLPTQTTTPTEALTGPAKVAQQSGSPLQEHGFEAGTAQQGTDDASRFARSETLSAAQRQSPLSLQMTQMTGQVEVVTPTAQVGQNTATQNAAPVQQVNAAPKVSPEEAIVQEFYAAMEAKDMDKIMSLYHPDAVFSDPAFPNISGKKLRNMWKLITGNEGLVVKTSNIKKHDDGSVTGHWDANYELIKGNPIFNQIDSKFEFKDGKIIKHTDSFDFAKWSDQAIPGFLGKLAGTKVGHFIMRNVFLPFSIR